MQYFKLNSIKNVAPYIAELLENHFTESPISDLSLGLDERPIGGLGLFLVKNIVTDYSYSQQDSANIVKLFFAADIAP